MKWLSAGGDTAVVDNENLLKRQRGDQWKSYLKCHNSDHSNIQLRERPACPFGGVQNMEQCERCTHRMEKPVYNGKL